MAEGDSNIEHLQFSSDEEALQFLKDQADDIASIGIPVGGPVAVMHKGQMLGPFHGIGMIVFMVNGNIHLFRPPRAERILNDGLLNRLRIRIQLMEGQA
jgi:hypothetical protein